MWNCGCRDGSQAGWKCSNVVKGFMACYEMCLPRAYILSIASSNKLSKVKTGRNYFFLNLSRILLAWAALTSHIRNLKPGTTCTFLLESDTAKRIAKIWRTFLWTSGNFMLGLNRKQVHFTKCQISFWLAHRALSPGCNNYFLLQDGGKD